MFLSQGKPGLASLLLLAILLLTVSPSQARVITENFDNGQFNPDLFSIHIEGTGPSAAVVTGHLEITLPSDSTIDPSGKYGYYLYTKFGLTGDYDVQVDFNLLTWPSENGAAGIFTYNCEVSRRKFGTEVYCAHFSSGAEFRVNTSDTTGALRLKKTGTTLRAFYRHGAEWKLIGSSTDPQFGQENGISIGSFNFPDPNARKNLKVAFDNLRITSPPFSPAIPPLLLD